MAPRFSTGHIPEPAGHRRTPYAHRRVGAGPLPSSASVRDRAPLIMDQGPTSSCVGHATAFALVVSLALGFVPSPDDIYRLARCIDRAAFPEGPTEPLADDGTEPNSAGRAIAEWGVRAMRGPTSDGRNSDCELATVNDDPKLAELLADGRTLLTGDRAIADAEDAKHALASKIGCTVAIYADSRVMNWKPGDAPLGAPDTNDKDGGWHDVVLTDYEETPTGTLWWFASSWGTKDAGDRGYFQGDDAWFDATIDRIAWTVARVPS